MKKFKNTGFRKDHYQELTDRIVAMLETGTMPWRKPWDANKCVAANAPMNPVTGRAYRGINAVTLAMSPFSFTTSDPRWCTLRQANERGWLIRKGEKSTVIFFYKPLELRNSANGEETGKTIPLLRTYLVFHASQIEGIPEYIPTGTPKPLFERIADAELIIKASGIRVETGGHRAFYRPSTDQIQMPPDGAFHAPEAWAATILHEFGHATGAPHRLNRDLTGRFGSSAYAREELRAELASMFVGDALGLPTDVPNHASYVKSWIEVLKSDKRELFRAAADAQRIADFTLQFHPETSLGVDDTAATVADESTTDDAPLAA
ncbi:zincin-like metallopeptidase domain-containing protein [uncultured Rhodoblastus sp.]|uniref:ArdC family protein n=1 Tax=uncultured Rhodoblastus sp. TaxID=543037 RepID=UPI0025D2735B|nr:zincin-like metallopeptidase domain-containing protein [uncultured Rhodoblastus sp.]